MRNFIQTGQVADLAYFYQTNGLNGNVNFFANPLRYRRRTMLTNYSNSTYNSLQLEARHRMQSGLSLEANYTFSKVLSDADGDSQTRFPEFSRCQQSEARPRPRQFRPDSHDQGRWVLRTAFRQGQERFHARTLRSPDRRMDRGQRRWCGNRARHFPFFRDTAH